MSTAFSNHVEREAELAAALREAKRRHGGELVILTHHYQRPEIVALGDYVGDSFQLARAASRLDAAKHIVFCGVHFMAESAAVLARPDQRVYFPNFNAGCPMAEMADACQVEEAWRTIEEVFGSGRVVPLTYMNSTAEVKAFCGERGGAVCTSSNAVAAFRWAFSQRPNILFLPDEHLGRNTAHNLGLGEESLAVWDPKKAGGGLDKAAMEAAKVILWRGYCHVHTFFSVEHVRRAREELPGCRIAVHPECKREVVAACDEDGSTEFLVRFARKAEPGSTAVIGTEINLVSRLASEITHCKVAPLARSLCPNMYRINLTNLFETVSSLPEGKLVRVRERVREGALLALEKMLQI